jgi:hypothetical protein
MDANDYILAVYVISGTLALGCACLPGAGPLGRLLNTVVGLGLVLWTASAYLRHTWYSTNPAIFAVPLLLLLYAAVTLLRLREPSEVVHFSAEHHAALAAAALARRSELRATDRRAAPGEYADVPINQTPPAHDPWAALYASAEREIRDGDAGRHRPAVTAYCANMPTAYTAAMPAAYTAAMPAVAQTRYAARQAATATQQITLVARQAEYATWQTAYPQAPDLTGDTP